jgi:hypothetical protein
MEKILGLAALVFGIYLLGFWAPRRWRRQKGSRLAQTRLEDRRERERRAKEAVEAIEVRLHEFAREVIATLDTKTAALKEHVQHAEAAIRKLEDLASVAPPPPPPAVNRLDDTHAEILHLHAAGCNAIAIAESTGKPVGEILLILGLHQQRLTTKKNEVLEATIDAKAMGMSPEKIQGSGDPPA